MGTGSVPSGPPGMDHPAGWCSPASSCRTLQMTLFACAAWSFGKQERRREQAQKRAERRKADAETLLSAVQPERRAEPSNIPNGFEFSTLLQTNLTPLTIRNKER